MRQNSLLQVRKRTLDFKRWTTWGTQKKPSWIIQKESIRQFESQQFTAKFGSSGKFRAYPGRCYGEKTIWFGCRMCDMYGPSTGLHFGSVSSFVHLCLLWRLIGYSQRCLSHMQKRHHQLHSILQFVKNCSRFFSCVFQHKMPEILGGKNKIIITYTTLEIKGEIIQKTEDFVQG